MVVTPVHHAINVFPWPSSADGSGFFDVDNQLSGST